MEELPRRYRLEVLVAYGATGERWIDVRTAEGGMFATTGDAISRGRELHLEVAIISMRVLRVDGELVMRVDL